ncbi:MAG: hypothetical protein Q4D81_08120 [Eubacteriales bacterium]|nr:hypothetical protein [Eubacteriales bacterium]
MENDIYIIEQFSQSKYSSNEKNEDGLYIGDYYIAVIDGATSKSDFTFEGKTGGQTARDLIMNKLSTLSGEEDAEHAVKVLQQELYDFSCQHNNIPLSASAVIYSCQRQEIWSIGDCRFSINGHVETNEKRIDKVFSETRAIAVNALLEAGYTEEELFEHDLARELLLPFLKLQHYLENKSSAFGFCVLNGDCKPDLFPFEMIRKTTVPDGAEIILASDGYPRLGNTLLESEQALQRLLSQDPLCYKLYYSTKGLNKGNLSFDDRTFIRFRI